MEEEFEVHTFFTPMENKNIFNISRHRGLMITILS
jgi:hypothetical protein